MPGLTEEGLLTHHCLVQNGFRRAAFRVAFFLVLPAGLFAQGSLPGYPLPGADLAAVELIGPVPRVDLLVDGASIFEPLSFEEGLSETEKVARIFAFARDRFLPWDARRTVQLDALFFGYGFGFCGEQSRILASLCHQYGIPARVVSITHHVMAEVRVGDSWRLLDPQHRCDFSLLQGQPVSFAHLRDHSFSLPTDTDPVGYLWSHMRKIYDKGEPAYAAVTWSLRPPGLGLNPNQKMVIRPRPTGDYYRLPIVYHRRPDYQADIIPFYLVEIEHLFDTEHSRALFVKSLPILAANFKNGVIKSILLDKRSLETVPSDAASLTALLAGSAKKVVVSMAPGASFSLTYALSGWIGDALFKAEKGQLLTTSPPLDPSRLVLHRQSNRPRLWVRDLQVPIDDQPRDHYTLRIRLAWKNLHWKQSQSFRLVVDELKTGIPMEYLDTVGAETFVWDPAAQGPNGSVALVMKWAPRKQKSILSPDHYRILLVQVSGPGVRAGNNFLFKTLNLPSRSVEQVDQ